MQQDEYNDERLIPLEKEAMKEGRKRDNASFFVSVQLWKRSSEVLRILGATGDKGCFFAKTCEGSAKRRSYVRTDTHSSSSPKTNRSRVEDFRRNSLPRAILSNSAMLESNLHLLFQRVT